MDQPPDLTIVHVDDEAYRFDNLVEVCDRHLHIPEQNILWRRSVEGACDVFRELAQQRRQVAAVVCNGEILLREDAEDSLHKMGGRLAHQTYQALTFGEEENVRGAIGAPLWVHHTSSGSTFEGILSEWNGDGPNEDVRSGAHKLAKDAGLAAALAIVMHVRDTLGIEDDRVQWAVDEFARDAGSGRELTDNVVYFLPSVHQHMRKIAPDRWPADERYWSR